MNTEQTRWSGRYQTALRKFLEEGRGASMLPAAKLGRQAVALGLETLDAARFHAKALATVVPPGGSSRTRMSRLKRAKIFFAETLVPIEQSLPAARQDAVRVEELTRTLRQRAAESSAATRSLERSITQRQTAEAALKKSGKQSKRAARDSKRLHARLQEEARGVLAKHEDTRQKKSRLLHDEIAQTLLAIDIRLLNLKESAEANTKKLNQEVFDTQRLVKQSVKTIQRLARRYEGKDEK